MESSILIHSNVSVTEVPLLSYDGKVRKIVPEERESDEGTMNFGTVGSGTENEAIFALENQNPINIDLHGWGVNMPGAVLELMGCQKGPADLLDKELRNITVCSHTGNVSNNSIITNIYYNTIIIKTLIKHYYLILAIYKTWSLSYF